jgi:hypothetical protein
MLYNFHAMKVGRAPIIIAACFLLAFAFLFSVDRTKSGPSTSQSASQQPFVERPAVKVILNARASGSEEERLGARDYLNASEKSALPGVVAGMGALCSEFHFYEDAPSPDFTLVFSVTDTNDIDIGLANTNGDNKIKSRHATSIDSSYFTACGMLRKSQSH